VRFLLKNLHWYSEGADHFGDLRVRRGRVTECAARLAPRRGERVLDARGLLALPGLLNGHDHLELNLLPALGEPPYANAYAWAQATFRPDESPIRDILRVSFEDRLRWGGYKNLIGGATTVVHHNPYHRRVFGRSFPIKVLKHYAWQHSLGHAALRGRWWSRLNGRPFLIHAAEGRDADAAREIDELDARGALGPSTVLVHCLGILPEQIARVGAARSSVVWCPASNFRLYGSTAPIPLLRQRVRLALGTDSTLSGSATLLDELRAALASGLTSPTELLEMVTTEAASVFGLSDGRGTLRRGAPADLTLIPDRDGSAALSLLAATPADLALVLVDGAPRLAGEAVARELVLGAPTVTVAGRPKWIAGDLAGLRRRIERVAGAEVLAGNSLWSLIG
jgi:cytosine/adenosine deaminase-related metal-dependent hydrolase